MPGAPDIVDSDLDQLLLERWVVHFDSVVGWLLGYAMAGPFRPSAVDVEIEGLVGVRVENRDRDPL